MSDDFFDQSLILRVGHRARIWALFQFNPNVFFTVEEISECTGLKPTTILHGLKFVRRFPNIQMKTSYENGKKIIRYGLEICILRA